MSIMPNKDCVISILTHFFSKTETATYNIETSVDLTSRNHYRAGSGFSQ